MRLRSFTIIVTVFMLACATVHVVKNTRLDRRGATRIALILKLRLILFAMHEYCDNHDAMPPLIVETSSPTGIMRHSWRAVLLPYTGPAAVPPYDLERPWNDEVNLNAAKRIDAFGTFAEEAETSCFRILNSTADSSYVPDEGTPILVSVPQQQILWSTPQDVTPEEVWLAMKDEPELVMVGLFGGCVLPLRSIVSTSEECQEFLRYGSLSLERRKFFHQRILGSKAIDDRQKNCSKTAILESA